MRVRAVIVPMWTLLVVVLLGSSPAFATPSTVPDYGALPLWFERTAAGAETVVARTAGQLFLLRSSGAMTIRHPGGGGPELEMRLAGASETVPPRLRRPLPGRVHYLIGANPREWQTDVTCYEIVEYDEVYPGVKLVYYGNQRNLQYDFVVAPGAEWRRIRMVFNGMTSARIDRNGDLLLSSETGTVRHRRPFAYQDTPDGRMTVQSRYVLEESHTVRFEIGQYDERLPLVIDPVLVYSTYMGGSGDERAYAIAVDASGNAYFVGDTWTTTGLSSLSPGAMNQNVLVAKLNATGTGFVYATYLGGSSQDSGRGIAIDNQGNIYITGITSSPDFPVTAGAWRGSSRGGQDFFVAKLNPTGSSLLYSVVAGGGSTDAATAIGLNAAGEVYVTGYTASYNFPTTPGAPKTVFSGGFHDAFVVKLDAAGSKAIYASYLGASGNDIATAIAVDSVGNAYLAGQTDSTDFPWLSNLSKPSGSGLDGFALKLDPAGRMVYCAPLAGRSIDLSKAITVDSVGNAYVAGATFSADFPVTQDAHQRTRGGDYDGFIVRLSATGNAISYGTFLGGNGSDEIRGIAVDPAGRMYVVGWTTSADFPLNQAIETMPRGGGDGFLAILDPTSAVFEATPLSGSRSDEPHGLALDASGAAYVTGFTLSADLPVTSSAAQNTLGGSVDVFVVKILPMPSHPVPVALHPTSGSGFTQTFTIEAADPQSYTNLTWVQIIINPILTGNQSCYISYYRPANRIYLASDDTSSTTALVPGTAATAANSRCSVFAAGSSVTGSGNTLRVTLLVSFNSAFSGAKSVYVNVSNAAGGSGYTKLGSWTVPGAHPPTPISVSPNKGTGAVQEFTFSYTDPDGHHDIVWATVIIRSILTGAHACYLNYHQPSNTVFLFNDAADVAWGVPMGSSIRVENSQCALLASSVSAAGANLVITYTLSFKESFAGAQNIYMAVNDRTGLSSGFLTLGSWGTAPNRVPEAISVNPATGGGRDQVFHFTASDLDGHQDFTWIHIVINSVLSGVNACYLGYHKPSNALYLFTDDATAATKVALAAPGGAANNQCVVDGSNASVSSSGTTTTLRLPLSFKPTFAGPKRIYMQASDAAGNASGFRLLGNWAVP